MISIRPSRFDDIGVIAEFQLKLANETEGVNLNPRIVTTGIEALFADPGKGVYYVAESREKIIGCFLITYEWSDWRNGMIWWLQSVYVTESHRREGVFKRMYDYIHDAISKDSSLIGLRLYVDKSNARAQKVYQSLGMNGDHYMVFEWMKN
ncbi:MAG: GNAT family N-acetyltransferase [Cyclobacteriaceae bacterium]